MVRRIQCVLLVLLLGGFLICPVFAAPSFPDVDEYAEHAAAVEYVSEWGIMVGDEKGNFNPYNTVTRAEMATIICRVLDETENLIEDNSLFIDVPTSHWANKYIVKAASLGIVSGYGNQKYGPSDNVTYEQAVTMIVRAIGKQSEASERGGYPDGFLAIAEEDGLLNGVFSANGEYLSRADIATILFNHYNGWAPMEGFSS